MADLDRLLGQYDRPPRDERLSQGPMPTGRDRVFDSIYGYLGGTPTHRSLAEFLTSLFDVGSLGMATGAYDGGLEMASSGRPASLAMAMLPGAKPVSGLIPRANVAARKAAADIWRGIRESPNEFHGLRATDEPLAVGKPAPYSREFEREKPTDVELPGSSTVGIDPRKTKGPGSIPWALERMGYDVGGESHKWDYYPGHVSLIGADKRVFGQDTGEWILDGNVIRRLSK